MAQPETHKSQHQPFACDRRNVDLVGGLMHREEPSNVQPSNVQPSNAQPSNAQPSNAQPSKVEKKNFSQLDNQLNRAYLDGENSRISGLSSNDIVEKVADGTLKSDIADEVWLACEAASEQRERIVYQSMESDNVKPPNHEGQSSKIRLKESMYYFGQPQKAIESRAALNKLMQARWHNEFIRSRIEWRTNELVKTSLGVEESSKKEKSHEGTEGLHEILVLNMLAGITDKNNYEVVRPPVSSAIREYDPHAKDCVIIDQGYPLLVKLNKFKSVRSVNKAHDYLRQLDLDLSTTLATHNYKIASFEWTQYLEHAHQVMHVDGRQMWPIPTIVLLFVAWVSGSLVLTVIKPSDLIVVSCFRGAMTLQFTEVKDHEGKPFLIGSSQAHDIMVVKTIAATPLTLFRNFYKTGCSAFGTLTQEWKNYEKFYGGEKDIFTGNDSGGVGTSQSQAAKMKEVFRAITSQALSLSSSTGFTNERVLIKFSLVNKGMTLMEDCVNSLCLDKSFRKLEKFKTLSAALDQHYNKENCHERIVELCALSRWLRDNWCEDIAKILEKELLEVHLWMSICHCTFTVIDDSFCKGSPGLEYRTRVYLPARPHTPKELEERNEDELKRRKKEEPGQGVVEDPKVKIALRGKRKR